MIQSQAEISRKMRDQLKILDPEISAEPGTPERKLIDVTAQAIAEANVDVFVQTYQYDVDTRAGQDLDDFLGLFGMARQAAKRASGRILFTRGTPAPAPVLIPAGTQVGRPSTAVNSQTIFQTVIDGVISQGSSSVEIPVEAVVPGLSGNVPANTVTSILSNISNVSGATNLNAMSNGTNDETDAQFRTRFKNTVLRNIAGTKDQFMAIAIASIFTSKATLLGPVSRFSEYLQVNSSGVATSNNPHSKHVYEYDYFLSSNGDETSDIYYPGIDYFFYVQDNVPNIAVAPIVFPKPSVAPTAVITGDSGVVQGELSWAYTFVYEYTAGTVEVLGESTISPPSATLSIESATTVEVTIPIGDPEVVRRRVYRNIAGTWYQVGEIPNNTDTIFIDGTTELGEQPPKPSLETASVVFLEHSYISKNSRNILNVDENMFILNKVDVYTSGEDIVTAKDVIVGPTIDTTNINNTIFNNIEVSKYYFENYVREFDGNHPSINNSLIQLLWTPVVSLPESITINNTTYNLNQDYFLVRDITDIRNSFRARDGIEVRSTMASAIEGYRFVVEYSFNRLPLTLNQIIEEHKQVTQDVLVHAANHRYFNVNLVVMYSVGSIKDRVDNDIRSALSTFFQSQPFGTVIQFSDITSVVHGVVGVDNVRIATSSDNPTFYGVQEVNSNGDLLDTLPFTSDFILSDIDLALFNAIGPNGSPIQRTQNTWISGF